MTPFEIGDYVRPRPGRDEKDPDFFRTVAPTGRVIGRVIGEGMHIYMLWMDEYQSSTVEHLNPDKPHLEVAK